MHISIWVWKLDHIYNKYLCWKDFIENKQTFMVTINIFFAKQKRIIIFIFLL